MCIIAYCEKGVALPEKKILKRCWDNNYMGAGYAYYIPETDTWKAKKGLMTWKEFWRSLKGEKFKDDQRVIIHFRIGTSGNIHGPDCTHPFIVSEDPEEMRVLEFETRNLVFHNGVISQGRGTVSDSMLAVAEFIEPLFKYATYDKKVLGILGLLLGQSKNRWLITEGKEVFFLGTWIIEDKTGIEWSNDGYLPPKVIKPTLPAYGRVINGEIIDSSGIAPKTIAKYENYFTEGQWDWEKWNAEHGEKSGQSWNPLIDDQKKNNEHSLEGCDYIYDEHDNIIGLLEGENEIILDDDLIPKDLPNMVICPQCGEDTEIGDSPLNIADRMCGTCGACFISYSGEVLMNDDDIYAKWLQRKQGNQKEVF
jgi:hypothetical protein